MHQISDKLLIDQLRLNGVFACAISGQDARSVEYSDSGHESPELGAVKPELIELLLRDGRVGKRVRRRGDIYDAAVA